MTEKARYMRIEEVAHELGYDGRDKVYRLIYDGELAATTFGAKGALRVARAEFERYCAARDAAGRARFGGAA